MSPFIIERTYRLLGRYLSVTNCGNLPGQHHQQPWSIAPPPLLSPGPRFCAHCEGCPLSAVLVNVVLARVHPVYFGPLHRPMSR